MEWEALFELPPLQEIESCFLPTNLQQPTAPPEPSRWQAYIPYPAYQRICFLMDFSSSQVCHSQIFFIVVGLHSIPIRPGLQPDQEIFSHNPRQQMPAPVRNPEVL